MRAIVLETSNIVEGQEEAAVTIKKFTGRQRYLQRIK